MNIILMLIGVVIVYNILRIPTGITGAGIYRLMLHFPAIQLQKVILSRWWRQ